MAARSEQTRRPGGGGGGVNDLGPGQGAVKRTVVTTQTTTTTTKRRTDDTSDATGLAKVEHLGKRATDSIGERVASQSRGRQVLSDSTSEFNNGRANIEREDKFRATEPEVEGNRLATTISTIAAQSSQSRIVVALLRDGQELQLKIQEMRPGVFEVGASLAECAKYLEEHQRLLSNLSKQKEGPIEAWLAKYQKLNAVQPNATAELRLIYLCMAENLQGCWRALLGQLELRLQLLDETCKFFRQADKLAGAIELADGHVQTYRREFLDGPGSVRFQQAANELRRLNSSVVAELTAARIKQRQLVELIGRMATSNLGDSRTNILIGDAQNLINFINNFIEPLERRKIQLESVLTTTTTTTTTTTNNNTTFNNEQRTTRTKNQDANQQQRHARTFSSNFSSSDAQFDRTRRASGESGAQSGSFVRGIGNFNDLNLAENWLNVKVDQLNSSLLSSLGSSAPDTRSILNKHEQIALECSAIEEATLNFKGKNIHAIKSVDDVVVGGGAQTARRPGQADLFAQQKQLAEKIRDVITILDARIILMRRTIDFYSRAKDATTDINKMMRRLQVDNSLQSVQFVADELELKDVSSVVASGATIISELQQLQLAQQHGQRSKIVNLNLVTSGIRAIIDQLNQDLAHLKTVLNQRRLVLLNEDATKMAQNFSSKCHQLKFWLDNHVKSHLLANQRIGFDVAAVRAYCDSHETLRLAVQQKTLEVEALLRLLSTLTESFDAKSQTADEIQRDTDELRQDWISVTNCLDARLEFARKYLAILNNLNDLGADIDLLGRVAGVRDESARPRTPDERTEPDIKSAIDQSFAQLTNQIKNFSLDASRSNTTLVYAAALESKSTRHDINKQQVVGHANGALKLLSERNKSNINRLLACGPRKWLNETNSASNVSVTTTTTETTSTKNMKNGAKVSSGVTSGRVTSEPATGNEEEQRARVAPQFVRQLADMDLEPFSSATLECELDPASGRDCRVEWLLNNKRIPSNIKHSIASEATRHRLFIGQFGPMCCGTYTARATNQFGQSTSSSCSLRLSGIREHDDEGGDAHDASSESQQMALPAPTQPVRPTATRWLQNGANGWQQQQQQQRQVSKERALERIIQGVAESPNEAQSSTHGNQMTTTTTTTTVNRQVIGETINDVSKFPVSHVSYDGNPSHRMQTSRQHQIIDFIDSPAPRSSASGRASRSISTTPFEGTPQPPVFIQGLHATSPTNSQAGLVCVVAGNPPPNVEWLHNQQPIASAKCAQPMANQPRANTCKLTIETLNDKTRGQYVCRATNRLGQTTTALTLTR